MAVKVVTGFFRSAAARAVGESRPLRGGVSSVSMQAQAVKTSV